MPLMAPLHSPGWGIKQDVPPLLQAVAAPQASHRSLFAVTGLGGLCCVMPREKGSMHELSPLSFRSHPSSLRRLRAES